MGGQGRAEGVGSQGDRFLSAHRDMGQKRLTPSAPWRGLMRKVVCPKCDASVVPPESFEDHMAKEHPGVPGPVGFGHTLDP